MFALKVLSRRNSSHVLASCNLLGSVICRNRKLKGNYINIHFSLSYNVNPSWKSARQPFLVLINKMSTNMLDAVPSAEIDADGTFKYILVKVYAPQTPDGTEPSKLIVRGNKRGPYHADIYDETVKKLTQMKLDSECIGGGKIEHNSSEKKINIFGSSQGFGKADHEVSAQILKEAFPGYEISWNDDGN